MDYEGEDLSCTYAYDLHSDGNAEGVDSRNHERRA